MPKDIKESISALMDDELKGAEKDALLAALKKDKALQETWRSFHIIRTLLEHHQEAEIPTSLTSFKEQLLVHHTDEAIKLPKKC
jgi:negative regulator of sigma E activity